MCLLTGGRRGLDGLDGVEGIEEIKGIEGIKGIEDRKKIGNGLEKKRIEKGRSYGGNI